MAKEIWVAGYPSLYGGADTELDHNIDLWRRFGVEVNLVPFGRRDLPYGSTLHGSRLPDSRVLPRRLPGSRRGVVL